MHFLKSKTSQQNWHFNIQSVALVIILALMSGCGGSSGNGTTETESATSVKTIKPDSAAPAWATGIQPEMLAVIEQLASYKDTPVSRLTPTQARKNHTPADAVLAVATENNITIPTPLVDTVGKDIPTRNGKVHARIYTPKSGADTFPIIVYFHGGGFVIADLDVYDASARGLAEQTGAMVVSVAYRLAPEHKFPAAHQDAYDAYLWISQNAYYMQGDPKNIAVAGESAGGNLAANVSIMARDKGITMPVHQLLVYPVANPDMNTPSYKKYAAAKPLNRPMMWWFVKQYLPNVAQIKDPRISLVNANLKGLPPTTIITAEIDPLKNDGEMLAKKLKDANVKVDSRNYKGVTHEFFGMALIVPEAKQAQSYAATALKKAFDH
jgi:acetyl esterase